MRESSAWLTQAKSDLKAADKLAGELTQLDSYCHVAAKAQQTVEKSLKALQSALHHAGLYGSAVNSAHPVSSVASGIRSLAPLWPRTIKETRKKIVLLLSDQRLETIKELDTLAPQYPKKGDKARKNTEYPFGEAPGVQGSNDWRAPAEAGTFSKRETKAFLACAQYVQHMTDKIVTALELAYP